MSAAVELTGIGIDVMLTPQVYARCRDMQGPPRRRGQIDQESSMLRLRLAQGLAMIASQKRANEAKAHERKLTFWQQFAETQRQIYDTESTKLRLARWAP